MRKVDAERAGRKSPEVESQWNVVRDWSRGVLGEKA